VAERGVAFSNVPATTTVNRGDVMSERRLVGIDLGIASAHAVRVLDGQGVTLMKRKALPTVESLSEIETAALAGTAAGSRLEVVIEPTGPAWLPIAVFFSSRGHRVYRVSSAESADLRRYLSKHAKTNGIDADTLARIPLFHPSGVKPLVLADADAARLDRRVRAADRLTRDIADRKTRIKALVRQLMPMSPMIGKMTNADLVVLERWADPNVLVNKGLKRLTAAIVKASNGHLGVDRAQEWLTAAHAAIDLYAGHRAVAFADLAAEIATEVRLLQAAKAELAVHATERENAYRQVDPNELARSLPGLAEIGGPSLVATMGDPTRFAKGKQFRSFTGLVPRASETGDTDRKGQPMSKAGSSLLRTTLVRAADTARKQDPQLARIYYVQMVERGKNHLGALCIVAANLAERAWKVMHRQTPYVICDIDGRPVTADEAAAIIAERWTVPADVRARRRNKKGKAPQAISTRRRERGDLPQPASSTHHERAVNTPHPRRRRLTA
jgi:transposase